METSNRNIIWLASWYPSKVHPFDGDFIQRHAQAASLFNTISVIHVVRDEKGMVTKDVLVEKKVSGNLTETIIYYYVKKTFSESLTRLRSARRYRQLFLQAIDPFIKTRTTPVLLHVHTGMKAGMIAVALKKKYGIQYIVTEHWTGFLPEVTGHFSQLPWYYQKGWRKVIRDAAGVSTVSHYLKQHIEQLFPGTNCRAIPNVVDNRIFKIKENVTANDLRFVHISNLQPYKNPEDIIKAFELLVKEYPTATLAMVGGEKKELMELAAILGIAKNCFFYREMPQPELVEHLSGSCALVLYSHYETFGCVIIEANACGIPVIVSDIPVFHETVKENENGLFAKKASPRELADAMVTAIKKRQQFDPTNIAAVTIKKYGYDTVGRLFAGWYHELVP